MKTMVKRILNWTSNSNYIALLWFEQKTSVQNMPYINKGDFFSETMHVFDANSNRICASSW
jgi:hypothetical protein